jgi:hypothetical protein
MCTLIAKRTVYSTSYLSRKAVFQATAIKNRYSGKVFVAENAITNRHEKMQAIWLVRVNSVISFQRL